MSPQSSQVASNDWDWHDFQKSQDQFQTGADIEEIATLQKGGRSGLPAWLNPNPNALTHELKQTYRKIPGMFDSGDLEGAYDSEIATVSGMGGQIATNAAREAIARGGQTGGQVNSEMAKAQAMLPVFQQTGALAKDKADAMLDAAKAQATIQAQVASTLGSLRTNYLTSLANVHMQKKGMMNSNRTNAAELALRKYQGDQQNNISMEQLAQQQGQFEDTQSLAKTQLGMEAAQKRSGAYMQDNSGGFMSGDRGLYDINQTLNPTIANLIRG